MVKHLLTTTAVTLALASAGLAQQATPTAPVQTGEQPAQAQQQAPPAQAQQGPQEPVRAPAEQAPGAQGGQATGGQQPLQQQAQPGDQQQPPLVEAGERAPQQEAQPAPTAQEEPAEEDEQQATAAPAAGEPFITAQELGQVRVDSVVGKEVVNPQNEEVGEINDLVFDEEGRLVAAVIGVGGFLGLGEKNVAVSWDRIEWTPREDGEVELSMPFTREELEQAPEFKDLETQKAEEEAAAAPQPLAGAPGAVAPTPAAPPAQQ
jgi:sporulation protein YlmC with PRC-barrel domain